MRKPFNVLAYLILIYCVWNARDLVYAWSQYSYYEKFGWLLLAIWCLPILYYWTLSKKFEVEHSFNPILLALAIAFSVMGTLGELRIFQQIGLLFILAAFIPWSFLNIVWIAAGFFWMPGSSWIASHAAMGYIDYIFVFRLVFLLMVSLATILQLYRRNK